VTRCWQHTASSRDAARCKAQGGACLQTNILPLFQSSSALCPGSESCWTGSGRCWGRRRDSRCYFADFQTQESSHRLFFAIFLIKSSQNELEHLLERSTAQGDCSRGGEQVHTLLLNPTEAGWRPSWQELRSTETEVWKRRLDKVRRRPRPADSYAKGCVCTGSSK